jgi:5-methylcytosine-specific restriction endonuclease McrA
MEQPMARVLLLNAGYEPLAVITHRRALSLLMKDAVEAACDEQVPVQGVSRVFYAPKVIRLRRYVRVPHRHARWSRRTVLQRDTFTCGYCGRKPGDTRGGQPLNRADMTVDHILPVSRGGKNTWSNTVCACKDCNQRKGNRMPHEAGMRLRWEPKAPRVDYWIVSGDVPTAWKIYLKY